MSEVDRYVMLTTAFLWDAELPLTARALGAWLLSHEPRLRFNVPTIARLNGCGEDQIKNALRALETAGYLSREQVTETDGKIVGVEYRLAGVGA